MLQRFHMPLDSGSVTELCCKLLKQTGNWYLVPGCSWSLIWYLLPGTRAVIKFNLVLVPVLDNSCILKMVLVHALNIFRILLLVYNGTCFDFFRIIKLVLVPVLNFSHSQNSTGTCSETLLHTPTGTGTSYILNRYCYQYQTVAAQLWYQGTLKRITIFFYQDINAIRYLIRCSNIWESQTDAIINVRFGDSDLDT